MIDATHLKAHRTAPRPACSKRDVPRRTGRTKGGLNAKLHAVCDGQGRPVVLLLSEGQMNDHKGAALALDALPPAIPPRKNRKVQIAYDTKLYRERHRIENMFAELKTGAVWPPATTDAPTASCQPSSS